MRIGELLIESGLINAKELDDALYYGKAKALPLGRCLKILRSISEENLARSLEAQKLIRGGLDAATAVDVLKTACSRNIAFHEVLKARALSGGAESASWLSAAAQVRNSGAEKYSMAVNFPPIPMLTVYQAPTTVQPEPEPETIPVEKLVAQGDQLLADDRCADAEQSYNAARERCIATHGLMHEQTASCLVKLANLYLSLDRFVEAEPLYEKTLEIYTKLNGPQHFLVAKALEDLGDLFSVRENFISAERYLSSSFAIAEAQRDPDIATLGRLLNKLATAVRGLERGGQNPQGADKKIGEFCVDAGLLTPDNLQQALQRAKQTRQPLGSVLRTEKFLSAQQLDGTLFAQMLTKQAMVPYAVAIRALAVASRANVPVRQIAESGRLISESLAKEEQYKQMVAEHEGLMSAEASLGPEHPEVARIAIRLADLLIAREDRQTATVLLKRAITILEKIPESDKLIVALAADKLASLLIDAGNLMEAQALLLKALALRQASGGSESPAAVGCLMRLGQVETAQENFASAVSFYRAALALHDKLNPGICPQELLPKVALCFAAAGLFAEAKAMQARLITWSQATFGPFEPETAFYLEALGDLHKQGGETKQAEAQYFSQCKFTNVVPEAIHK